MDGLLITITIPLLAGYRVPPMYNNYYHFLANKTEDPYSLAFLTFYNFLSCSLNSLSSALVLLSNVADKKEPSPATLAFERPIKGFRLKMVLNGAK